MPGEPGSGRYDPVYLTHGGRRYVVRPYQPERAGPKLPIVPTPMQWGIFEVGRDELLHSLGKVEQTAREQAEKAAKAWLHDNRPGDGT